VLDVLNEVLATELVCVLRYKRHYFMAQGMHGPTVAAELKEHADDEQRHADLAAERIAIATYAEIARWLGEGDPTTRRLMEQLLSEEEEHADDLRNLLTRLDQP
jgi:bacterioferritin